MLSARAARRGPVPVARRHDRGVRYPRPHL